MPRYISFMLTKSQIQKRTKTVTRRLGWKDLKPGTILMGAEKCQGLGKGGKIKPLGPILVTDVRQERLDAITREDVRREGFPFWGTPKFVEFFCASHRGCTPETVVTRIEFEYVDAEPRPSAETAK